MKAWPILFITACQPHSNCELGQTAHETQARFYIDTLDSPLILELWPALPISEHFEDLIVLDESWLQQPFIDTEITVDLPPYEGVSHSSDSGQITAFLPAIFEDKDGDGQHSQGEPYWTLSQTVLLYANDLACGAWSQHIEAGWNAVTFSKEGLKPANLNAIELVPNLLSIEDFSIAMESENSESLSVAFASQRIWREDYWVEALIDQPSQASMQVTLPTLPPDEHLQAVDVSNTRFLDWYYAVELPLLYRDDNDSGALDIDDSLIQAFCDNDAAIRIGHYPEADRIDEAFYLIKEDIQPGWGLYKESAPSQWTQVDPLTHVLTPGSCRLP